MEGPVVMAGETVSLRIITEGDVQNLWQWINDPEVKKHIRNPDNIYFYEDEVEWYQNLRKRKDTNRVFIIQKNEDSTPVGVIGVHFIDRINGHAEVGYFVGQQFWSKGYGTEALSLILKYSRDILNLRKVYAFTHSINGASARLMEKNGFKKAGEFKKHDFVPGEGFQDLLSYEIFL